MGTDFPTDAAFRLGDHIEMTTLPRLPSEGTYY